MAARFAPTQKIDIEKTLKLVKESLAAAKEQKRPVTSITPSSIIENRPNIVVRLEKELKENKDNEGTRNILVITDASITEDKKDAYIDGINKNLRAHLKLKREIDISSIYRVVTYDEMKRKVRKVMKKEDYQITAETALEATEALAKKVMPGAVGEIVYIGGLDLYKEELDLAWMISEILSANPNPRAIERAITLLGKDAKDIRAEDLRRNVIDLRGYTKEISEYQRAIKEVKRAL